MTFAALATASVAAINHSHGQSIDDRGDAAAIQSCGDGPTHASLINDDWLFANVTGLELDALEEQPIDWISVDLPHDWAIAGPFDPAASGSQGKLPWKGEGLYRRSLDVCTEAVRNGSRVILLFDGVMANPTVFVNGDPVGSWHYGYNSFWIDITDSLTSNGDNEVAVHASTMAHHSRWYPGAGIYRKVRLILKNATHIPVWGIGITAPQVSEDFALIDVRTEVSNSTLATGTVEVTTQLVPLGTDRVIAGTTKSVELQGRATQLAQQQLEIVEPALWSPDSPRLYEARIQLISEDELLDEQRQVFGVRDIKWTGEGFLLNFERYRIKGVNLHHDNGPLGAAVFEDSLRRKLTILKDMGANAIRTSHNPPAPELLDLADEMGFLIVNELFDKYGATASVDVDTDTYIREFAEPEVRNFVRRDRNHPSVILWSVGNEISDILNDEGGTGAEHVQAMHDYFKKYDPSRDTIMSAHILGAIDRGVLDAVDVQGWNYGAKYALSRAIYPSTPMLYTESASAFSTRGFYDFPPPGFKTDYSDHARESAYDLTAADWADLADVELLRMQRENYVVGEFVWTGFDYLGEPTPHTWAARSSYFGIVDLVGLPKDRFYLYRSEWNTEDTTVHILPHWTWPGREGMNVPVYVYTSGDEAELFLNGSSLGRKRKISVQDSAGLLRAEMSGATVSATSEMFVRGADGEVIVDGRAINVIDGSRATYWRAEERATPQTIRLDLGRSMSIGELCIDWELNAADIHYRLWLSANSASAPLTGSAGPDVIHGNRTIHNAPGMARYVHLEVLEYPDWALPTIKEIELSEAQQGGSCRSHPDSQTMDQFRLRWDEVVYQPGELKAIAYSNGSLIGEASVRTAAEASSLRLTAEASRIVADGQSLAYLLVEAVDTNGVLSPHESRIVEFSINGPAVIAGIGNGNPLSLDPFQDTQHPLFFGKAVLIVRSLDGVSGPIEIAASANGLESDQVVVQAIE